MTGGTFNGVTAFAIAAATLVFTLAGASIALATVSERRLDDLRTHGPHVKRFGGFVLIGIGMWFVYLAAANLTYQLP